tara:strand:- start:94 stop:303 length:210 start_codon:yes stop_codon:yes gene_type:complete
MTLAKQQLWLVEQFQAYCKKHHLPNMSADDLLAPQNSDNLTGQQIDWLQTFIQVWEVVEYDVNQDSGKT